MGDRITLRVDERLIERARRYARRHGKSVSRLVAEYFEQLDDEHNGAQFAREENQQLPPLTRSLRGLARGSKVAEEEYGVYLTNKYLKD